MMNIHPIVKKILEDRGLLRDDEQREFLSKKPQKTYDPFLLFNMKAGVDLLLSSIERGEKICVYGDYDADGVTSVSLLYYGLSHLTSNLMYYIPSRFDEGYGLNREAMKHLNDLGVNTIVTVDCGTNSYEEVEYVKELGMNILITDHHGIGEKRGDCLIINPKQEECQYPYPHLAGVGVAFKLLQALIEASSLPRKVISEVLDLVAIGTIGDVVPLTEENRTLVKYGIGKIKENKRIGLRCLLNQLGIDSTLINGERVAFSIVPHINAAGRMADAEKGVELFLSKEEEALTHTSMIMEYNRERKKLQEETLREVKGLAKKQCGDSLFPIIYAKDAHEGITGIIAGRLKDELHCPVAIVTDSQGNFKATSRTYGKVDLYRTLSKGKDLFLQFGGHKGACGFLLEKENLDPLRKKMKKEMSRALLEEETLLQEERKISGKLKGREVQLSLYDALEELEPFGNSNEKPVFQIEDVILENQKLLGKEQNHVKFSARDMEGNMIECILFQKATAYMNEIASLQRVTLFGSLSVNQWRGHKKIQFIVEDIKGKEC